MNHMFLADEDVFMSSSVGPLEHLIQYRGTQASESDHAPR